MAEHWHLAAGDNDFAAREEEKKIRSGLLTRVKDVVRKTIQKHFDAGEGSNSNGSKESMLSEEMGADVCAVLEAVFSYGWRDESKTYFSFIKEGLRGDATVRDVLTAADTCPEVKTDLGRARLFVWLALCKHTLAYCVHRLQDNVPLCNKFFNSSSLWVSDEGVTFPALLVSLNSVNFQSPESPASLDDRAKLNDVLEDVQGGKQEVSWGPFGFITRRKSNSKVKVMD